jgi:hypothetical protein
MHGNCISSRKTPVNRRAMVFGLEKYQGCGQENMRYLGGGDH